MVNTFVFVCRLYNDEKLKNKVYECIEDSAQNELDICNWHLRFDVSEKRVYVTDNGGDPSFSVKFVPGSVSFRTLVDLLENNDVDDSDFIYYNSTIDSEQK